MSINESINIIYILYILVYKMVYFSYLIYRCWISYTSEWSMWVFVRGPVFISIFVRVLYIFNIHVFTSILYRSFNKAFENIKRRFWKQFRQNQTSSMVGWEGVRVVLYFVIGFLGYISRHIAIFTPSKTTVNPTYFCSLS